LENIKFRIDGAPDSILVFWCQILSNRDEMHRRINALKGDMDITPIILRGVGFDNPNAVLSDLNKLIHDHKHEFERGPHSISTDSKPLVILLLSLTPFTLPQISSLITLPPWFPKSRGENVFLMIEDLTVTANGSLNTP